LVKLRYDPTHLINIFTQPSPTGDYYITQCNLNNLANCQQVINAVITYAQKDFSTQIQKAITPGDKPQGSLALDQTIIDARRGIAQIYDDTQH
jgi:hypothetical protein